MIINKADTEILLSLAEEMASYGYRCIAYPLNTLTDSDTIQFFKSSMGAEDYCLIGPNDTVYFKSMPIDSLINNLKIVMHSGIDTAGNDTLDLTAFARLEDKKEILENNLNTNIMNQKNLEFLKDQLKYTGFGETFEQDLKEKMLKGETEFKLTKEGVYGADSMIAVLNFKKSDQTDLYFFNSYHVNLKKENSKDALEQTFYINNNSSSITLKEAYNLLEGRSVNKDLKTKEGEVYNAWIVIDFKNSEKNGNFKLEQYHQNYGYDLEGVLSKYPIKELGNADHKENLLSSLKRGNLQSVTINIDGADKKYFIQAEPHFKTIKMYDENMQRVNSRETKEKKQSESEGKSTAKESRQNQDNSSEDISSEKNRTKSKRKANSL